MVEAKEALSIVHAMLHSKMATDQDIDDYIDSTGLLCDCSIP